MKIKKNIKIESRKKRDFGVPKKKSISQSIKILILINMRCSGSCVPPPSPLPRPLARPLPLPRPLLLPVAFGATIGLALGFAFARPLALALAFVLGEVDVPAGAGAEGAFFAAGLLRAAVGLLRRFWSTSSVLSSTTGAVDGASP